MKMKIFIQTNERQWLGALVAAYSLKRNSAHADAFDVETMHVRDYPFLAAKEGQPFLRGGVTRVWHMHDQRVEGGPVLGRKDACHRAVVAGVGAKPINRFGRKRDKLPGFQQASGAGYAAGIGLEDFGGMTGHGS